MTRAVMFASDKGDLPFEMALKNNLSATTGPSVNDDTSAGYEVGSTWINTSGPTIYTCVDATKGAAVWKQEQIELTNPVAGIASGYKIARGVHQQASASDTVPTGLATVVAVVASWRDTPTLNQMFVTASIGNQSGAPVAGSILINTYKPTANNDVTPVAATDFTDDLNINWIAVGI